MKKTAAFVIICMLIIFLPAIALASEASASADATGVKAGEEVAITLTVSGTGIAAAQGSFTYDPSVLTFVSGSGGAADGTLSMVSAQKGGSDSLTAVVKFSAAGAGESVVTFSLDSTYDYSGASLGGCEAAVSIAVSAAADAPADIPASEDISKTGIPAKNAEGAQGAMYIWRSLSSLTLPGGYADRQVEYHGEFVGGAAVPDTDYPVLLYLSEADGQNAGYYVFDAERDILYPYQTLTSVRSVYTLMRPEDGTAPPDVFSPATLTIKEREFPAWQPQGGVELFLVYAKDPSGAKGFYLYDPEGESMQRYIAAKDESSDKNVSSPASAPGGSGSKSISLIWFCIVCGACVILLMLLLYVIIINGARNARHQPFRRSSRRR